MRLKNILQSIAAAGTIGAIAFFWTMPGCRDFRQAAETAGQQAGHQKPEPPEQNRPAPQLRTVALPRSSSRIVIGSMNIQTLGVSKIANPDVMSVLTGVARQFDCLAIQEIRSKNDQTILRQFVDMINRDGSRYDFFLSPLLGDTSQKFQFGVVFDTARLQPTGISFMVPDPQNLLHREPMVTGLRTRTADPSRAFSFALVNVHIDPDQTRAELDVLAEVYQWLKASLTSEDDIILLGDFNEPPHRYGNLWQIPTLRAALPDDVTTNTRGTAAYDNILFDGLLTAEFTGQSGVLDMQQAFGLTREQALAVSDHLPVWAGFTAGESLSPQYATQPPPLGR